MSQAQLGDARHGKLASNLSAFGRALRRAGLPLDAARIALAQHAALLVGLASRPDLKAALETVLVSREQDRAVFSELFDTFFKDPDLARKLLAQMLPKAPAAKAKPGPRPRVADALRAPRPPSPPAAATQAADLRLDAAMTASALHRLRQADFNRLSADEYALVERLAREIPLPLPPFASRRTRPAGRGAVPHWSGVLRAAARTGGELIHIPRRQRRLEPPPLVVLVDVSGSMERYTRLLLAFLHAATRACRQRQVFAIGTHLTPLHGAFRAADTDQMLEQANQSITDFAGGTRLGECLQTLHQHHARCLVGRRSLVLLVSDGLDTGDPTLLHTQLARVRRRCGRLLWLNPLLRFDGYAPLAQGAQALHTHCHAMLAVHNLHSLNQLAHSLAELIKNPNPKEPRHGHASQPTTERHTTTGLGCLE